QEGDGRRVLHLHDVYWPVWSWKGKVGVLQLDDADIEDGWLGADHVRSARYERFELIDDFEGFSAEDAANEGGLEGYGPFWEAGFGAGPSRLEPLALKHGLPMLVGRRAALSRGLDDDGGSVEMRSLPFRIEREGLSFVMFDFGGPGTRVELRVDGEARRSWSGQDTRRLQGIVWGVRGLIGREAVLAVVDEVPGDAEWIGIDDVAVFDWRGD
ncbi:MAG TPA: hypothetical protein VMS86_07640, partial [Thermoanaerobaculia bacterium]|nr:hypothetical protein [Thermoanaerobaculia bacterium]